MTTAMQILRIERTDLTIASRYGIITAEKEFMRSWILDFLIASISHRNGLDHSFDHLRLRTTWKQCPQEHPKAPFSDTKAPKSLVNQGKNRLRFLWGQDVAGSNPVIPTKIADLTAFCGQIGVNLIICHRRQSTVVLNCRIRCPSELGLLHLQDLSSIFILEVFYEKHEGYSCSPHSRRP